MRRSMFGDYIVESTEDDIGEAFIAAEVDPDECYALLTADDAGDPFGPTVEIIKSEDGETVVETDDSMFKTFDEAREWALGWVKDVQMR